MSDHHKLTLTQAILINMNIMFGAGAFTNVTLQARMVGSLSALLYFVVGVLFVPLIYALSQLVTRHPNGGFYVYGSKELNPVAGFIGSWGYFIGKLGSATLGVHIFVNYMHQLFPQLGFLPEIGWDIILLTLFALLNVQNLKLGSTIQLWFMVLKVVPIIAVIISAVWLFNSAWLITPPPVWNSIPMGIPYALFAFTGFEAMCALSHRIENAEKNAPLAVIYSFGATVLLYTLYQFLFYACVGSDLITMPDYTYAFPKLFSLLHPDQLAYAAKLVIIPHVAIAISALGLAYGVLFTNSWNLYALAQHDHTFFKKYLTALNTNHIPSACVAVATIICFLYLAITRGLQVPLQQIGGMGCTIGYTMSVIAYTTGVYAKRLPGSPIIGIIGIASCAILLATCIRNFILFSPYSLVAFSALLIGGLWMFFVTKGRHNLAPEHTDN